MLLKCLKSIFIRLTIGILLIVFWVIDDVATVQAKLYSCLSPSGTTIYTDSPSQLKNCQPISMDQPLQTLGADNPSPSSTAQTSNVKKPPASSLPSSPPNAPVPQQSPNLLQDNQTPKGNSLEQQPCVSAINPLNPLLNRPCPTVGD